MPHFPGLGVLLVIAAVYVLGVIVTSLIGTWLLRIGDAILRRVPGLNLLYKAWKDILVLPPGKMGQYHQVVLVPRAEGSGHQIGFTSGELLPGDVQRLTVFVPGVPNPIAGQLVLVEQAACLPINVPIEEAFKFLLSTGNYLPDGFPVAGPGSDALPTGSSNTQ